MSRASFISTALLLASLIGGGALVIRHPKINRVRADYEQATAHREAFTPPKNEIELEMFENDRISSDQETVSRARFAAIAIVKAQPAPAAATSNLPPPSGPRGNRIFAELLSDPDYARLCLAVFTQDVDERYGAVLTRLQSEPQKAAALKQLLIERQLVELEAEHIAVQQGLSSIAQPEARYRARDLLEEQIRNLVGAELYAKLK